MTNELAKDCPSCHREMPHLRDDLWECPIHKVSNMPVDDEANSGVRSNTVCPRINYCSKINVIMDKDILDSQAADAIRNVCAKCTEVDQMESSIRETQGG